MQINHWIFRLYTLCSNQPTYSHPKVKNANITKIPIIQTISTNMTHTKLISPLISWNNIYGHDRLNPISPTGASLLTYPLVFKDGKSTDRLIFHWIFRLSLNRRVFFWPSPGNSQGTLTEAA